MKLFAAITTTLLALTTLVALAPTGAAVDPVCVVGEANCPRDQLACVLYPKTVCVRDPCATTHCIGAAPASASAPCFRQDYGYYTMVTCVNPTEPDCLIETTRYMAGEAFRSCAGVPTLTATTAAPVAAAKCYHLAHGSSYDSFLCYDVKGPIGCKVYTETYTWGNYSRNCIA